jgi:hypothetical protein
MELHGHQTIEALAYSIYIAEGRPEEPALKYGLEAEKHYEVDTQFKAETLFEPNMFGSLSCSSSPSPIPAPEPSTDRAPLDANFI